MGFKIVKNILHVILASATVLVAVLFVVSAYSNRIPPDKSLVFSYLGLVFPFILVANLFVLVYWLIVKKWKVLLVGLAAFLISWGAVRSYFPIHKRTNPVPTENVIKILTYNVMGFAYRNHTKERPNEIIRYIAGSGADIVCLQEYYVRTGKNALTAQTVDKALGMYPYRSVIFLQGSRWGLAVYSKFPISKSRKINYESRNNGSSIHEIDVNGKTITLINNHLESFKLTMEDKSRYSDFIKNTGPETFDGLRGTIQQKLGPAYLIRARQARVVANEISKIKSDYTIVCGDFNDTPVSYAHYKIQGPLLDAFAESGRGPGITYNQNFFWFRIDNIFHSPNIRPYNCTVDKVDYSDHYPLWCYLQLN